LQKAVESLPAKINIGAVSDTHVSLVQHHLKEDFAKRDAQAGWNGGQNKQIHYNSGVTFCRDNEKTRQFFSKWHELWMKRSIVPASLFFPLPVLSRAPQQM
jgi:hypothetical protein